MSSLTTWVNETPKRRRTYEQERLIVDVAEAVQRLLDKAGMKRAELGRRTGIARQSLHQMLSGQQNLTLRTMATIAHELGYRVSVSFEPYSTQETRADDGPDPDRVCTGFETSVARIPALPISAEDEAIVDGAVARRIDPMRWICLHCDAVNAPDSEACVACRRVRYPSLNRGVDQ